MCTPPRPRAALAFAAEETDQAHAPLTVVCAWNVLAGESRNDAYVRAVVALDEGTMRVHERQAADERLDAAVDWVRWNHPDLSVTALMPEGSPAVELLRTGADAGLIVVGNPGPQHDHRACCSAPSATPSWVRRRDPWQS